MRLRDLCWRITTHKIKRLDVFPDHVQLIWPLSLREPEIGAFKVADLGHTLKLNKVGGNEGQRAGRFHITDNRVASERVDLVG